MSLRVRLFGHTILRHPELTGVSALTLNYLVMTLAVGMVSTFGVLFVYHLGASPVDGLKLVFLFYFFQRVVVGLISPLAGLLTARIGFRRSIVVAQVALIVKLLCFSLTNSASWFLVPALFAGGVFTSLYYVAFHALFVTDGVHRKIGEQFGTIAMVGQMAEITSPLFAGLLIERFGFSLMFLTAVVILSFSVVPLFLMEHHLKRDRRFSMRDVAGYLRSNELLQHAALWRYVEDAILAFFWPIYLFLVVGSYAVVGAIGSVTAIASAVMVYVAGRIYDRRPLRRVYPAASLVVGVSWILRFLSTSAITAGVSDVIHRLVSPLWSMKIRRAELVAGERIPGISFGVAHELVVSAAALTGLLFGYGILLATGNWFWLVIPSAGAVLLSAWLMKDSR